MEETVTERSLPRIIAKEHSGRQLRVDEELNEERVSSAQVDGSEVDDFVGDVEGDASIDKNRGRIIYRPTVT